MRLKFFIITTLMCLLFVADIYFGAMSIDFSNVFIEDTIDNNIFFNFRLPKAITAILAGVALSVSGLMMQTIFRNPLAGPDILGISSGASFGVAIFMLGAPILGVGFIRELGVAMSAWIGAAAILTLVMAVSIRIKDIMAVLILGIIFSYAISSLVGILQYFSSDVALKGYIVWGMGSLDGLSWIQLYILTGSVIVGAGMAVWAIKPLNILLLGENYARSMGLNLTMTRGIIFASTALLAGGVTAFCGPIAFIGIAVPHIARIIFRRADHHILIPASALIGACMMLLSDFLAHTMTLPINIITSLLGIPVIVMVVFNSRKNKVM